MALRMMCLPMCLTSVWLVFSIYTVTVEANPTAMNLDVSLTYDPTTKSGLLTINCSVDPSLTNMETVATLTVLGANPYGSQNEFDRLAVFDMWSQTPRLSSDLEDAGVTIRGGTDSGNLDYLTLSWNVPTSWYRQFYKCVANGIDSHGQAESVVTTAKVELLGVDSGCGKTVNSIESELRVLSGEFGNASNIIGEVLQHVQTVPNKIDAQDGKLGEVLQRTDRLDSKLKALEDGKLGEVLQRIDTLGSKLEALERSINARMKLSLIDRSQYDVSGIFKDRVYLASKQSAEFDIEQANLACQASEGYLLEIDDDDEYRFVENFAKRVKGTVHFYTGANDVLNEGTFVYYNSQKLFPKNLTSVWGSGEPNDDEDNEDCTEIRYDRGGLNDVMCDGEGKFVCEVPLN